MKSCRSRSALTLGLFGATTALLGLSGCRGDETETQRRGLSTTALRSNRVPAHVVGEPQGSDDVGGNADSSSRHAGGDAGPLPALPLDDREPLGSDALATRDTGGVLLDAEWRWSDLPGPANAPETAPEALDTLRAATRLRMRIEVASAGRIRIAFEGQGYAWPDGTELRARSDRLGHVLVWPDGKRYRTVVNGALRSFFADRRLDRGPLFAAKLGQGPSAPILGLATTRLGINTPIGEIQIDQAVVAAAGAGALLLCRFLVELVGVDPESAKCAPDQLALHANIMSAPGGKLQFIVNQMVRKQDFALAGLQVPPDNANFEANGVPIPAYGSVPRSQLTVLRHHASAAAPIAKDAPKQGLVAANRNLGLRTLLLDGIPIAWLPPGSELSIPELRNGTYTIAWRDFFATAIEPAKTITLPARVVLGKVTEGG